MKKEDELAQHVFECFKAWSSSEDLVCGWCLHPEVVRRTNICESCEWFVEKQDPEWDTDTIRSCRLCGCPVDSKVIEPLESCPEKKWVQHFESFYKTTYADIKRKLNKD